MKNYCIDYFIRRIYNNFLKDDILSLFLFQFTNSGEGENNILFLLKLSNKREKITFLYFSFFSN